MQGEIFGFWEDPSEARAQIWKNQRNLPGLLCFRYADEAEARAWGALKSAAKCMCEHDEPPKEVRSRPRCGK